MGFTCGIVGLPNAGKSTVFNAITTAGSAVASYPFCTIEPKEGIVPVPDPRLSRLAELVRPEKVTPTTMSFVDIAGLVKGAHKGEGLGNQFLAHIRQVDAIAHVLRCFADDEVSHVHGQVDPLDDYQVVLTELLLADLETVQRRLEKTNKLARVGDKDAKAHLPLLEQLEGALMAGRPASSLVTDKPFEQALVAGLFLLTAKPAMIVANFGEEGLGAEQALLDKLRAGLAEGIPIVPIAGKLEMELSELEQDERDLFAAELGLTETALERLIVRGYRLLDLLTFYTTVGTELRAWTVKNGTKAPKAAGKIHGDMEQGFIKAEVIPFEQFSQLGSEAAVKKAGGARIEGKEYVIHDGDVVTIHFKV